MPSGFVDIDDATEGALVGSGELEPYSLDSVLALAKYNPGMKGMKM